MTHLDVDNISRREYPVVKEMSQLPYLCCEQPSEVDLRDHLTSSFTVAVIITVLRFHL